MNKSPFPPDRLAVCSWSLQPAGPRELLAKLAITGLSRVQLALDPLRHSPQIWGETARLLRESGIEIVSGMFGCVGEDYSTMATIHATGGIAPDATWAENLKNISATADLAATLGLRLVTFHAGFLPPDPSTPAHAKMLNRLGTVAGLFDARTIGLGLETGQESASALAAFLNELNCPNVGVNFDPANMILYGQGDPVAGLRILRPRLFQVHVKDGKRAQVPGVWGEEVPVGRGEVDWTAFFAALREMNFTGHLVIEREAGAERVTDICAARDLVLRHLNA